MWSAGIGGCGLADDGEVVEQGRAVALTERCRDVQSEIAGQVAEFDPDVVVVLSEIYDLQQRRLADWDGMRVPGDPGFDEYLANEYANVYDVLSSGGARVVWMTNPCARTTIGPWPNDGRGGPLDEPRVEHVNEEVLDELANLRPDVRFFDLYAELCPDGKERTTAGGVDPLRIDGVHFTPDGSRVVRPHLRHRDPRARHPLTVWSSTEPRAANLRNWESRVPVHAASQTYDLDGLVSGRKRLSDVVAFDEIHLGDLTGLDVVHLQCHIGTDTISLARLGARAVGLDFSPGALAVGRDLADRSGLEVSFVEGELYGAVDALGEERFDLVYTGIGALCWLPDIRAWAKWSPGCCGRVAGSTCERAIRCSGPPRSSGPGASS